jgi:hypothetical protein
MRERSVRNFELSGGRAHVAKDVFQPCWGNEHEQADPRRADNKRLRLKFREKHALSCLHSENFLSHVDVEFSVET